MKSFVYGMISALVLALAACGGDDGHDHDHDADANLSPSVTATSNGSTVIAGEAITLSITATNFELVDPATNTTNADGHGHYHVYLDNATGGDYLVADFAATAQVTIPAATSAGAHTLKVQLFNNDHSAITPEVSDTVAITVAVNTAASVTASADPTTIVDGTTDLTVAVENFTLVDPGTHTTNVPGEGHYHVYLDDATGGDYLTNDYQSPVHLTVNTTAGPHTLRVELHNNDHSVLTPIVEDIVNVTVVITAQ